MDFYKTGQLFAASDQLIAQLKASPQDLETRLELAVVSCFQRDWDRAWRQIKMIRQLAADPMAESATTQMCILMERLLDAETARQQFYAEGRAPELLTPLDDISRKQLEICVHVRKGDFSEAAASYDKLMELRRPLSVESDGTTYADMFDLDDLCSTYFEAYSANSGGYYWIPFTTVERIRFEPRQDALDLLWRQATIEIQEREPATVWIPAVYVTTPVSNDEQLLLGKATDWQDLGEGELVRGIGLRYFQFGETTRTIHDIESIEFKHV